MKAESAEAARSTEEAVANLFAGETIASARTLADRVTETLMRKIIGEELAAGARLPTEHVLAKSFGVSRTVVREAVSRLKSEGLVESRQGSGAFVRRDRSEVPFRVSIDWADPRTSLLRILEFRLGLDPEIAAFAALRHTRDQIATIQRALHAIEEAAKAGRDAVAADLSFHLSIAQATRNPIFIEILRSLGGVFYRSIAITRANDRRAEKLQRQVQTEHLDIYKAIAARDPAAARAAARTHIEHGSKRILSADPASWTSNAFQALRRD